MMRCRTIVEKNKGIPTMRGADVTQDSMFSYLPLEGYVPKDHPLRPIREIVNTALREPGTQPCVSRYRSGATRWRTCGSAPAIPISI